MLLSLALVSLLAAVFSSAMAQLMQPNINLVERFVNPPTPPDQRNIVIFSCTLFDAESNPLTINELSYHRRDPRTDVVTKLKYVLDGTNRITFSLTPDTEGDYFCRGSGLQDSETLQLTAYPIPDEAITQTVYAAQEGGQVTLPCDFEVGILSQLYTYSWFKSGIRIISSGNPDPNNKYVLTDSFSLIIDDLDDSDSDLYWCLVQVNNPTGVNDFVEMGRNISLEVYDAARVTGTIENQVLREGSRSDPFTCVAQGTPLPTIQWTFGGSMVGDSNIESDLGVIVRTEQTSGSDNEITSSLTVKEARARDNVEVVCTATNQPLTQSFTLRNHSTAILTVLPTHVIRLVLASSASPDFTFAIVNFNLSNAILGEALLHVRYLGEAIEESENVPYPQAIVVNTLSVHFELPPEDWKDFDTFRVRVALTGPNEPNPSDDMFTGSSNPVTIRDNGFQLTSILVVAIVAAAAAVFILFVLIIATCVACICWCKQRTRQLKIMKMVTDDGEEGEYPLPWQAYWKTKAVHKVMHKTILEQRREDGGIVVYDSSNEEEEEEKGKEEGEIQNMHCQNPSTTITMETTTMETVTVEAATMPLVNNSASPPPPKESAV